MYIKLSEKNELLIHLAVLGDVLGDLKVTERARSLGVHHSLRDPLPVKVGDLIDQLGVGQEDGAAGSGSQGVGLVTDGGAPTGREAVGVLEMGGKIFVTVDYVLKPLLN